jgi:hypothetical protein
MRSEDYIRSMYRSYIELWACSAKTKRHDRDILHGAILAYGRVLEFNAKKIQKDMEMAANKYSKTTYR